MNTFTKDMVRNLTPEQLEALGKSEADRLRLRQLLLERARRGMTVTAGLFAGLAGAIAMFGIPYPRVLPFAIIAVSGLATYYATRLHRRMDAVVELLESNNQLLERQNL